MSLQQVLDGWVGKEVFRRSDDIGPGTIVCAGGPERDGYDGVPVTVNWGAHGNGQPVQELGLHEVYTKDNPAS